MTGRRLGSAVAAGNAAAPLARLAVRAIGFVVLVPLGVAVFG